MTDIIGFTAAALTTFAFIPQLIKAVKSKDTSSLSVIMLIILIVGLALWLTFGFLMKSAPIIAANGVSMLLIGSVLVVKIKYG